MKLMTNVICFVVVISSFLWAISPARSAEDVVTIKVGDFEVSMLSERQRESDTSILVGASESDIKKYIPSGKYPTAVNAFLIRSPQAIYLVDTGYGEKLFENMASLGVRAEDVDYLLITHGHGDHIGGMTKDGKPTLPKAKVYVSKREAETSEPLREKLALYEGRVAQFTPLGLEHSGAALFTGISAIAAYGHTPGHTIYQVESKGEKMLIWGDLIHAMAIQIPRPGISATYDRDPVEAAAMRKSVLQYAAKHKIKIGGMHIAYPGIGLIETNNAGDGEYIFIGCDL